MIGRRHHELVHAVADLGVLERPVGAEPAVARRPGRAVVGGLEDAVALHDGPEAVGVVGVRQQARAGRGGPAAASAGSFQSPRPGWPSSVEISDQVTPPSRLSKMPDASPPGEQAAVRDRQARDLRELQLAAVAVAEPLARELPARSEVVAPPDTRTVPLARGRRVDRARLRVVHRVVDRPALAVGAAHAPVTTILVALEHEAALAGSDQQSDARHRPHSSSRASAESRRPRTRSSSDYDPGHGRNSSPASRSRFGELALCSSIGLRHQGADDACKGAQRSGRAISRAARARSPRVTPSAATTRTGRASRTGRARTPSS